MSDLCPGDTRFYTAYISCARLLECKSAARQTVVSAEWDRWAKKPGNRDKAATVQSTILDEEFWAAARLFCKLVKPIVRLMRLVDSNMPSMGKVSTVIILIDGPYNMHCISALHNMLQSRLHCRVLCRMCCNPELNCRMPCRMCISVMHYRMLA